MDVAKIPGLGPAALGLHGPHRAHHRPAPPQWAPGDAMALDLSDRAVAAGAGHDDDSGFDLGRFVDRLTDVVGRLLDKASRHLDRLGDHLGRYVGDHGGDVDAMVQASSFHLEIDVSSAYAASGADGTVAAAESFHLELDVRQVTVATGGAGQDDPAVGDDTFASFAKGLSEFLTGLFDDGGADITDDLAAWLRGFFGADAPAPDGTGPGPGPDDGGGSTVYSALSFSFSYEHVAAAYRQAGAPVSAPSLDTAA